MVEEFIARKGFIPNLTSRMSAGERNKLNDKYINIKKGTILVSLGAVTLIETRLLIIDLVTSKLKAYGYKTVFVVLLSPVVQMIGLPIYVFSGVGKLRGLAITLSDIGSKIRTGEISVMNWMWLLSDLAIFGEGVPLMNLTDLMLLRNETNVINEFCESLE